MTNAEKYIKYDQIVKRAESLGIFTGTGERISTLMDIENADLKFNLKLDEWLKSDDDNFTHDYYGIVNNINRISRDFGDFIPRFAERKDKRYEKSFFRK